MSEPRMTRTGVCRGWGDHPQKQKENGYSQCTAFKDTRCQDEGGSRLDSRTGDWLTSQSPCLAPQHPDPCTCSVWPQTVLDWQGSFISHYLKRLGCVMTSDEQGKPQALELGNTPSGRWVLITSL